MFYEGPPTANGPPGIHHVLSRVFKDAGVRGHPHRFRTTFAVAMLEKGVAIESVSMLLGHQNITVTQKHYAPWIKSRQDELEAAVKKSWQSAL